MNTTQPFSQNKKAPPTNRSYGGAVDLMMRGAGGETEGAVKHL
ncbi:MAG: hypothetical protein OIN90_13200 [Candidatus Methanoperedens sp.]|nr:hypothetical protein [Candidatus Methanoperedens sp.]